MRQTRRMTGEAWVRRGHEILALLLAAQCPGCDRPGTLLCEECAGELAPCPVTRRTPGGVPVRAALRFDGVAARCIRRVKEDGQTMLARPLGDALGAVLPEGAGHLVPVPTSRAALRRRGYRVPELLLRRAGAVPSRLLLPGRATGDQRSLGAAQRALNVRGSMRVGRAGSASRPGGSDVVIVDDVVTTGATIDEAARVLEGAGFHVAGAIALAATPLRGGERDDTAAHDDTARSGRDIC